MFEERPLKRHPNHPCYRNGPIEKLGTVMIIVVFGGIVAFALLVSGISPTWLLALGFGLQWLRDKVR